MEYLDLLRIYVKNRFNPIHPRLHVIRIIVNRKGTTGNPPEYLEIRDDKFATGRANIRSSIPVRIDWSKTTYPVGHNVQLSFRHFNGILFSYTHAHPEQCMQKDFSHDEKLSESRLLHRQCSYCGTLVRFNISWNESFLSRAILVPSKRNETGDSKRDI